MAELTAEQKAACKVAFELFDKDKSGSIDSVEVVNVMRALRQHPTDDEVSEMMKTDDLDGDGVISYEEFERAMAKVWKIQEDKKAAFEKAFRCFDADGSKTIDRQELKAQLQKLGKTMTEEQMDELMDKADKDKDGTLDYEEFVRAMMS